jgi:hypothetical protein
MTYNKRQQLLPYKPAPHIINISLPHEIIKGEPFVSPKGFRPGALLRMGYRFVYQFNAQFKLTTTWMHHLKIPSEDNLVTNCWVTHTFYYHGTGKASTPAEPPKLLNISKGFTSLAELYHHMMLNYPDSHDSHPEQLQLTKERFPECFI